MKCLPFSSKNPRERGNKADFGQVWYIPAGAARGGGVEG